MNPSTLIYIAYCLVISFSLSQFNNPKQPPFQQDSFLGDCSPNQYISVYVSISKCEQSNTTDITKCIGTLVEQKLKPQEWNVVTKRPSKGQASVLYWRYDNCFINLYSYGRFNNTYYAWPIQSYDNETDNQLKGNKRFKENVRQNQLNENVRQHDLKENVRQNQLNENVLQNQLNDNVGQDLHGVNKDEEKPYNKRYKLSENKLQASCPSWVMNQVQSILKLCDIKNNYRATNCIKRTIRNQLGQYWNAIVYDNYSVDSYYWYYSGCDKTQINFGLFNRSITLWKAHS